MTPERTPWCSMLKLGVSLGIAPAQLWRLSLKEWRALIAPAQSESETLPRATFEAMARRFPDRRS